METLIFKYFSCKFSGRLSFITSQQRGNSAILLIVISTSFIYLSRYSFFEKNVSLKSDFHHLNNCFYLLYWKNFKMVKNIFYFVLITVLQIFTFLSCFFGYVEKRLNKKAEVNFKFLRRHRPDNNTDIVKFLKKWNETRQWNLVS